jgi:transposase-like protein
VVVTAASSLYKGHRYPPEIIAHCVWLYHRFPLGIVKLSEVGAVANHISLITYDLGVHANASPQILV